MISENCFLFGVCFLAGSLFGYFSGNDLGCLTFGLLGLAAAGIGMVAAVVETETRSD